MSLPQPAFFSLLSPGFLVIALFWLFGILLMVGLIKKGKSRGY